MTVPPFMPDPLRLRYVHVADHLTARITVGDLPGGQRLPPERDLATEYRVSYTTIRKVAELLRQRGLNHHHARTRHLRPPRRPATSPSAVRRPMPPAALQARQADRSQRLDELSACIRLPRILMSRHLGQSVPSQP